MTTEQGGNWNQVVMMPAGSGMSVLAHQVVMEQVIAGGALTAIDIVQSADTLRETDKDRIDRIMGTGEG